ncbi:MULTISPECIES: intradiol ring-cleavage dioxygenase [unclassified Hyphomicrobium]|uniref:intradiol ring-cleavage dioxygenase n=1 Tax=unclassified Hyphomicrobium TaxID=2619925 RepID=UPI000213F6EA|nr:MULTISPECIES: intradiol ring-cleavage dioxygenase [unclassified Hyphomicrobium]CCB66788.1 Intradiol ring-cleavage dioxygenase [Hyphomicrobium sp. MC1]
MKHMFSRRQAVRGLLLGTAAVKLVETPTEAYATDNSPVGQPGECTLFPQAIEGPYYFDRKLIRSDIREGRPGLSTIMLLTVIDATTCKPMTGARVDVWHADARGVYSGYAHQGDDRRISTTDEIYLRGTQMTDGGGRVLFRTIYPGWYPGRTPHIHVKVFLDELTLVTGQIYFPDDLSKRIYREQVPYKQRPNPDTDNNSDFIFKEGKREGGGIVFTIDETPDTLTASLVISVDRTGSAAKRSMGWGPYLRQLIGL